MFPVSDSGSHVRRYLTTLGVAIVIGSLSAGSLFLRDSGLLAFKQADLAQLTPTAQQTVERRQSYLLVLTNLLPWLVVGGVLTGSLLVFFGLVVTVSLALIGWRGDRLRSPGTIDSPLSANAVTALRMIPAVQEMKQIRL